MEFSSKHPFEHVYRELFGKVYDQYLYHSGRKSYATGLSLTPEQDILPGDSLDNLLKSDSDALLDKLMNTASSIVSRIKIHGTINQDLDYHSCRIGSDILALEAFYVGSYGGMSSGRQRSTLSTELLGLERERRAELVSCWRDLQIPMSYFIQLYHQYKGLGLDRRLIEG